MTEGDYFRISSLPYLCAREEVLASQYEIIRAEKIPPHLRITFDIGDRFHELYRNVYWGPMGEWVGAWECKRCGWNTDTAGLSEPPEKGKRPAKLTEMPKSCPDCGALQPTHCRHCGEVMGAICPQCGEVRDGHAASDSDALRFDDILVFKEWHIFDHRLRIKGHPDGWRRLEGSRPSVADIKSHGFNGFKSRNTPRQGHRRQVWSYQWCSDETKTTGSVLYLNKSPWGDHTAFVRDIKVPFVKEEFNALVVRPMESLNEGLAGGPCPERICIAPDSPRAKECQLRDVCFG